MKRIISIKLFILLQCKGINFKNSLRAIGLHKHGAVRVFEASLKDVLKVGKLGKVDRRMTER